MGAKEVNERRQRQDKAAREAREANRWFNWWHTPSDRFAFFVALFTLFLAILAGIQSCLMGGQLATLQTQVGEMKAQRLMTIEQIRANIRWEQPQIVALGNDTNPTQSGPIAAFSFSPRWQNAGSTTANNFLSWFDIRAFERKPPDKKVGPSDCPAAPIPIPAPIPIDVPQGEISTGLGKDVSVQDILAASGQNPTKYILMWGHVEYRDAFPDTLLHFVDWCAFVAPNDPSRLLFSFINLFQKTETSER